MNFEKTFRDTLELEEINEKNFVQYTGLMTATMRAIESKRPDRIIDDPYAERLSGEKGKQFLSVLLKLSPERTHDSWLNVLPIRTKYLDDFIDSKKRINQVVILAAGLDSRSFRLHSLKDSKVFEIDVSPWFLNKTSALREVSKIPQQHSIIQADLCSDDWDLMLLDQGFNPSIPTLWSMEGLLYYLHRHEVIEILKKIDQLSPAKSCFWADMFGLNAANSGLPVFSSFKYGSDKFLDDLLLLPGWDLKNVANLSISSEHHSRKWEPFTTVSGERIPFYFFESHKAGMGES